MPASNFSSLLKILSWLISPNFVSPAKIEITDATGRVFGNDSLPIGNYCVVVKDGNGCVVVGSQCFTVLEPQKLQTNIVKANKTCTTGGNISVLAYGGTGTPLFTWRDLTGANQPVHGFDGPLVRQEFLGQPVQQFRM